MIRYVDIRPSDPVHKFAVGASVVHRVEGRPTTDVFKVTRQLPDSGQGFQYRIKGEKDATERVVSEQNLAQGPKRSF